MKSQKKGAVIQRKLKEHLPLLGVLSVTALTVILIVIGVQRLKQSSIETQYAMSSASVDIETGEQGNSAGTGETVSQAQETAEQSAEPAGEAKPSTEKTEKTEKTETTQKTETTEKTETTQKTETAQTTKTAEKVDGHYDFSKIAVVRNPIDEDGPSYQKLYPELVVERTEKTDDSEEKVVYLTFDDGPTKNTEKILDILDEYGVHATFFVSAQFGTVAERAERMNKILKSGSEIGLHTKCHRYEKIYASVPAFLEDLRDIYQEVYEATGYRATLTRFPGGSMSNYNQKIVKELTAEVTRRGFTYHDWSVSVGDAEGKKLTAKTIAKNTVKECEKHAKSVVLFHDTNAQSETVKALPSLIEQLLEEGYAIRALNSSVQPFQMTLP